MCGIAGILSKGRDAVELRAVCQRMTDAMGHRGPDDAGVECLVLPGGGQLCLGHRRLSILDVSATGHQPMCDPATGSWIAFNGEIYNHLELRRELSGVEFRSTCDTETLLRGWAAQGPQWLDKLRGIFAFAMYDARREELWLARDHFGVKPLYVANPGPGLWLFASEVRALLASGLIKRRVSLQGLTGYLAFGSVQSPMTLVDGVRSLLPAERLRFDLSALKGEIVPQLSRYWSPGFCAEEPKQVRQARREIGRGELEELRVEWERAVSLQLLSDVPLGAFLSGGTDSSAIVATLTRLGHDIKTFSVTFCEQAYDESQWSRAFAKEYGTEHHELTIAPSDVLNHVDDVLAAYDQPSVDGMNTYVISQAVREAGIKVALSGLGGDEVFAGYSGFHRLTQIERLCRSPLGGVVRILGRAAGLIVGQRGKMDRYAQLARQTSRLAIYAVLRQLFSRQTRDRLTGGASIGLPTLDLDTAESLCQEVKVLGPVNAVSLLETSLYMQNTLLRDTDQMSMVHALEVRVPLLDHVLVERIARIPGRLKLASKGQPSKWLLVELADDPFLRENVFRKKMGFTFPFDHWLRRELRSRVDEVLLDHALVERSGLCPLEVSRLWKTYLLHGGGLRFSDILALWHYVSWVERHGLCANWADE